MFKDKAECLRTQRAQHISGCLERELLDFSRAMLADLDRRLDRRLVQTFFELLIALIQHRHRNEGGWMSEMGSYLVPENAEAGKKRIQKLLYSRKWDSQLLEAHL